MTPSRRQANATWNPIGQTFITDTSKEKIPQILSNLNIESNLFWIENGNSSKLN